jgi:hypothetical protein
MSEKIIQICPCEPDVRIAYDNEGLLEIYPPTCLAIIERCSTREIVYMETVDNEIKVVDTEDKNFLEFLSASNEDKILELKGQLKQKYENVKPKQQF